MSTTHSIDQRAEGRDDGGEDFRIGIAELDDDAAKIILMAAINWGCTPEEAAKRLLNDATKPKAD